MQQRLLAVGDSLTLGHWDPLGGWVGRLRQLSDDFVRATSRGHYAVVYNLGISSDTSGQVVARYEAETAARLLRDEQEEAFVVLAVGINDSQLVDRESKFELTGYEANMDRLVALALADTSRVVLVGLTPVVERLTDPVGWDARKSFRNDRIVEFDNVARRVAEARGVQFVSLFSDAFLRSDRAHLDWDGLHLSALGHQRAADMIGPILAELGWDAWPA